MLAQPGSRNVFALFLGAAMCVSAIPVIAKTLMDMNLLHRDIGQLTLTAGMIDDAVGWLMVSVVTGMVTSGSSLRSMLFLCGAMAVALMVTALAPRLLRVLYRSAQRADGAGPAVSLTAVLILLAAAGALALGLEPLFGAFLCGIACTASGAGVLHLAPLRVVVLGVLAPVFLASAGLRMDLGALVHPQVAMVAGAALAAAVVGKFAGAYLGARTARLDRWQAVALGGGMNARGVVEVVVAMVGLRLGILTPAMYTVVVMIAVVTSLMAAPIIRFAVRRIDQTPEEEVRWLAQSGPSVSETPAI
jgi:Kef-type K+ transport system membrane component KefB